MVYEYAKSFDMNILIYDIDENSVLGFENHVVDFDELIKSSDVITLHPKLNETSFEMINRCSIKLMKDGVIIINTSRGDVINSDDLLSSLESGKVGFAALDVLKNEFHSGKLPNDPLIEYALDQNNSDKILITPHAGGATLDAHKVVFKHVAKTPDKYMNKKVLLYIGSRANYSSARSLLYAFKNISCSNQLLFLVRRDWLTNTVIFEDLIKSDGFKVNHKISFLVEGGKLENMAQSCGIAMNNFPSIIEKYKPDYIFVIGDRFDVLPIASTAMLMNIPLAHSMGGERSGTIDESIRHAISKMANLHFVANADAMERLKKMGELSKQFLM